MKGKCLQRWIILSAGLIVFLGGCEVRREADGIIFSTAMEEDVQENSEIYRLRKKEVELGEILEVFLGMTAEEAEEYYYYSYEVGDKELSVACQGSFRKMLEGNEKIDFVSYKNQEEWADLCYGVTLSDEISEGFTDGILREYFPEEDLDVCSKEEAIAFCKPYAEAMGYTDAKVSVYAITLDLLTEYAKKDTISGVEFEGEAYWSAPSSGVEYISNRKITELWEAGKDEEAVQLEALRQSVCDRGKPWEKKHEAILLTYQPYVNDNYLMNQQYDFLKIVYVPYYDKPVLIQGDTSWEIDGIVDIQLLIDRESAVGEMLLMKGYASWEEIELEQITLSYEPQWVSESNEGGTGWYKLIPCWKIQYRKNEQLYTCIIDAVYGDVYTKYPEN